MIKPKTIKNTKDKSIAPVRVARSLMNEFKEFLSEYKILGIAAGLVIGSAITTLTQSLVAGLITPLLRLVIPADSFKDMVFTIKGVDFQFGLIINAIINFLIIALLFFFFVKFFMKQDKVTKDVLMK